MLDHVALHCAKKLWLTCTCTCSTAILCGHIHVHISGVGTRGAPGAGAPLYFLRDVNLLFARLHTAVLASFFVYGESLIETVAACVY